MSDPDELQRSALHADAEQPLEVDRLIHAPARLMILAALLRAGDADFPLLEKVTHLQKSNLSMQTARLERAGYITMHKYLKGKFAATRYRITPAGRTALARYLEQVLALPHAVEVRIAQAEQNNQASYKPSEAPGRSSGEEG